LIWGRANLPYVIHWDYKQKYDLDSANPANSINPIINFLRDKPYEHRVIGLRFPRRNICHFTMILGRTLPHRMGTASFSLLQHPVVGP